MKWIIANWKMHLHLDDARSLMQDIVTTASTWPRDAYRLIVLPPSPYLLMVKEAISKTKIVLGAQNVSHHLWGAYTGEVSVPMLASCGVKVFLVGHSERRAYHHETNALIRAKVEQICTVDEAQVIVCVGETLQEKNEGRTETIIREQLNTVFSALHVKSLAQSIAIAYEPRWAIGTQKTPSYEEIVHVHACIWDNVLDICSLKRSALDTFKKHFRIFYGGSVHHGNIHDILALRGVSGVLLGGSSLRLEVYDCLVDKRRS